MSRCRANVLDVAPAPRNNFEPCSDALYRYNMIRRPLKSCPPIISHFLLSCILQTRVSILYQFGPDIRHIIGRNGDLDQ